MRRFISGIVVAAALGGGMLTWHGAMAPAAHADTWVDSHTGTVYTFTPAPPLPPGIMYGHDETHVFFRTVPVSPGPCETCPWPPVH